MKKQCYLSAIFLFFVSNIAWSQSSFEKEAQAVLREIVLKKAVWAMAQQPVTVTATTSPLSSGSKHDFFSQADYFWPNPVSADSPYVQKDGQSNPDNFVAHRLAMIKMSQVIGALGSAYIIKKDSRYVKQAMQHARAWFVDTATLMHPNLAYTQAVIGRYTGTSFGIIDGIHLMEVVKGLMAMEQDKAMDPKLLKEVRKWFSDLLTWFMEHPNSKKEMVAINNHSTCWFMQVAAFAQFTGNERLMQFCRKQYKEVLLPNQMALDGSFPLELRRTKPYGYSLFNLDAMVTLCQILSTPEDNLWKFQTADGRSIKKGIGFLYPYIAEKQTWPYKPDIMYWNEWPIAQPSLLFGAAAFNNSSWFNTWAKLDHDPQVQEVVRNLPVRNPLIWMSAK